MAAEPVAPPQGPGPVSQTMRGILFMLAGFLFYSLSDALAKQLTQSVSPLQIAWMRQLGLAAAVIVLLATRGIHILRSRHPAIQIGRGLTVVVASVSFVSALAYIPLTDAVALTFVAPFLVTIFGALLLGEAVGVRRWLSVAVGFLGTLVIIRPGMGAFHPAVLLVLLSAVAFALRQVISRFTSGSDALATTVAYTAITATLALSIPLPFVWTSPTDATQLVMMIAMACVAGCAEVSVMRALELAQAVVVSPLQYTLVIWSTLWGFLVFAQLPDLWTLAGTAIIIASGIYSIWHDARTDTRVNR